MWDVVGAGVVHGVVEHVARALREAVCGSDAWREHVDATPADVRLVGTSALPHAAAQVAARQARARRRLPCTTPAHLAGRRTGRHQYARHHAAAATATA